jgi:DNA-binding transcriptional regulator YiaG
MNIPLPKLPHTQTQTKNDRLSPEELKTFLMKHGISILEFSSILGKTRSAIDNWLRGYRTVDVTTTRIVRLLDKYPTLIREFNKD